MHCIFGIWVIRLVFKVGPVMLCLLFNGAMEFCNNLFGLVNKFDLLSGVQVTG